MQGAVWGEFEAIDNEQLTIDNRQRRLRAGEFVFLLSVGDGSTLLPAVLFRRANGLFHTVITLIRAKPIL